MDRRILVLPKTEPYGFTKISDVRVNSRVMGIQMYQHPNEILGLILDYRIQREGLKRFEATQRLRVDIRSYL